MNWSLGKYIDIRFFLISFAIGIFFVYITLSESNKIYVYPSPENMNLIQYQDKADQCFEFKETPVQCPADKKQMFQVPFQ
jgi:hypothetical protein